MSKLEQQITNVCKKHDTKDCVYCESSPAYEIDYLNLCCAGNCNNGCDRYDVDKDNELAFS